MCDDTSVPVSRRPARPKDPASDGGARPYTFLCDAMLGSLCRWLRFLGLDAEFAGVVDEDAVIAEKASRENRWLLTRDRELASKGPPRTLLIRKDELEDQLVEVCRRLSLDPRTDLGFARCAECNGVLEKVARDQVGDLVPPYVAKSAARFKQCRGCGRVYWPGTHSARIEARLERVLATLYHRSHGRT